MGPFCGSNMQIPGANRSLTCAILFCQNSAKRILPFVEPEVAMKHLSKKFFVIFLMPLYWLGCNSTSSNGAAADFSNFPAVEVSEPMPAPGAETPVKADLNCVDTRVNFTDSAIVQEVCRLVNKERSANKLKPLVLDMKLSHVAQAHAEDMVNRQYFSHDTPEGLSPFDRMKAAQISYMTAGENIAYWYKTPAEVMASWMNSSGHRANILNSKYGKIGVGYEKNYWVQDFTN
jgi:uncharacterized protein YkwD